MKQITRAIYIVEDAEKVTFEIVATKVGDFASITIDGNSLSKDPGSSPPSFQFTVTAGPGQTHYGVFSCFFPDATPDDANYQLYLTGSSGGGKFTGSDVQKSDDGWDRGFELRRL
jgi:hypothetical protein